MRRVMENKTAVQRAEQEQAKRKLEKQERRISELDRIIQQLYEDRVSGALSAERFAKLSGGYEKEQEELKQSAKELQTIVNTIETQAVNVQSFLKEDCTEVHRAVRTDPGPFTRACGKGGCLRLGQIQRPSHLAD